MVANAWLEGTYSELYPHVSDDAEGMKRLFRQFSFPGGIPSHAAVSIVMSHWIARSSCGIDAQMSSISRATTSE